MVIPGNIKEVDDCAFSMVKGKSLTVCEGVETIGIQAFSYADWETVSLPLGIKSMGKSVFACCKKLKSIEIPEDFTSISCRAFSDCTALEDVRLPEGIKTIEEGAFKNCVSLESIIFPENLKVIGEWAFAECEKLRGVTFPEGLESIGGHAFQHCQNIENIYIPASVTGIGYYAFNRCYSLKDITVSNENLKFVSHDGVLFDKAEHFLFQYPIGNERTSYNIPVTSDPFFEIWNGAFDGAKNLVTVTLPDDLYFIWGEAFLNVPNMTSVRIPKTVHLIDVKGLGYTDGGKVEGFTIYGYKGSEAERYANAAENMFIFIPLDEDQPIVTQPDGLLGDVNLNGIVDATDASMALEYYSLKSVGENPSFTPQQKYNADIDENEIIDAIDASSILSYYTYSSTGGDKSSNDFFGRTYTFVP